MEILFVSTELAPFAKVGGLADVSSALPKTLKMLGHSVTIVMPRYPHFEQGGLLLARRLTPLKFTLGERSFEATVFDGRLASQVSLVLVDVPGLLDRPEVYGEGGHSYPDNSLRFAVLSRAAVELARERAVLGKPFDILHCNDWPTALVPAYAANIPELEATKTVLTIHNLEHQGICPKEMLPELGLNWDLFTPEAAEFYGSMNALKLGIVTANAVTTVSPTYAREIQTEERGAKLEGVLKARVNVTGILNGVDPSVWNPTIDPAIASRFDAADPTNRMRCRSALQQEVGLRVDPSAPLFGFIGRLVPQKGIDILLETIPRLLRSTACQIVIMGDGADSMVKRVEEVVAKSDGRVAFVRAAPEPQAHRLFAGVDFMLIPSRYEPCGLVQLYAHRYGAIPVARATGGIVDTVVDCDAKLETGTGFLFDDFTADALLGAAQRAVAAQTLPQFGSLVRRVMRLDRSWDRAARRYEQIYRSIKPASA